MMSNPYNQMCTIIPILHVQKLQKEVLFIGKI